MAFKHQLPLRVLKLRIWKRAPVQDISRAGSGNQDSFKQQVRVLKLRKTAGIRIAPQRGSNMVGLLATVLQQ